MEEADIVEAVEEEVVEEEEVEDMEEAEDSLVPRFLVKAASRLLSRFQFRHPEKNVNQFPGVFLDNNAVR